MPRPRFESLEPDRRAAILDAAAAELAGAGFEGSSYNRIIARAGVSKGAMYYYFDGKEDLVLTTLLDAVERARRVLGEPPPFEDAHGFWDSLGELYERAVGFVAAEPTMAGLLQSVFTRPVPTSLGQAVAHHVAQLERWLCGFLEQGRAVGAVRDDLSTSLLARLLTALGDVTDRWFLAHWDDLGPEDLAEYPRRTLELHVRVAAPLELVLERERRNG